METLDETWIRDKHQTTVPVKVRRVLNLDVKDGLRWILCDNGEITVKKIVSRVVNNNVRGKNNGNSD